MPTTTPTVWLAPVKVNTTDVGPDGNDQTASQIIALGDGRFFVAYADNGNAFGIGAPDIYGRFVGTAGGFTYGNDFIMNSFVDYAQGVPAIARGPGGGVTLVYQTTSDPLFNLGEGMPVDRFAADGSTLLPPGPPWINTASDETSPAIAAFADGGSVVVYEDNSGGDKDLRFRLIDSAGNFGAALDVATGVGDQASPDVAVLSSGDFVTVYLTGTAGNHDLQFVVSQTGGAVVASGAIDAGAADETDPAVTAMTGGGFVAVWTDAAADGNGTAVMARIYTNAGLALPGNPLAFVAPTNVAGDQKTPSVAPLADGGFIVVWDDDGGARIAGQRYDASGTAVGAEFAIATMNDVSEPDVALLDDGRIAVSFTDTVGGNSDIYTTIFDPRDSIINGTGVADVLTSRIDGATVNGLGGADSLLGQAGNDVLDGGAGNDSMTGGAGNDRFYVDSASDTVFELAGGGSDRVFSSVSYTLAVGQEVEILSTANASGIDAINLTGNAFNNLVVGNAGANVLNGGAGADQLYGYAGNDSLYVDNALDRVFEVAGGGVDRVFASVSYVLAAGQQIETLSTTNNFGAGAINLTGNEFGNTIYGNAGANVLNGGAGIDTLGGLGGNDSLYVDNALDAVIEAAGGGTDRVFASVSYTLTAGQEVETLSTVNGLALDAINLTGNAFNNLVVGNAGANVLNGGVGADQLYGYGGNDSLYVDNALDRVFEVAGGGVDRVLSSISYALAAGQEIETLSTTSNSGAGAINLTGNEFSNTIYGNAGANVLNGGLGIDTLWGLGGNDSLYVDNALDVVIESAGGGTDRVFTSVSYTLAAGQEIETLSTVNGLALDAIDLTGNAINNTMVGNGGTNVINGAAGNDLLYGYGGSDTFVFNTALNAATNHDSIMDYNIAADTIDLDNAVFTLLGATGNLAAGLFHDLSLGPQIAGNVIIYDRVTGNLFYDSNGVTAGGQTLFADVTDGLALTNADFFVV